MENDKLVWLSEVINAISAVPPWNWSRARYVAAVASIPAVDAMEVVHADWVCRFIAGHLEIICSNCGEHHPAAYMSSLYCPNCGAQMGGAEDG